MARVAYMAAFVLAACLGGCGSSSALLDGKASQAGVAKAGPSAKPVTMVTLVPITGAPPHIQDQIARLMTPVAMRQSVILRSDGAATNDYALRGYLMVDRNKAGAKILYVWDLLDRTGSRVNRVAGEEPLLIDPATADTWSSLPPTAIALVADKATELLLTTDTAPKRLAAVASPPSGTGAPVAPGR